MFQKRQKSIKITLATVFIMLILIFSVRNAIATTQSTYVDLLTISGNDGEIGDGEFYCKFAGDSYRDTHSDMVYNNPNSQAVTYDMTETLTINIWYTLELWEFDAITDDNMLVLKVKVLRDFGAHSFTIDTEDLTYSSPVTVYTILINEVPYFTFYIYYRYTSHTPHGNIGFTIEKS